ncbi:MAG: bifunctional ornithine acetyltransferase/N-acetylglutamate synthase [Clostridia bacterium]|jgi:glutamate N-acetyltransferase/amino-acid N-acetyltransferase|nr:bifunctional ornithine acetyltransferase/N-acetylglutamate synthase [Clostridia bacterium]
MAKGIKFTEGGVCAAKGFVANGIHCGIRKNKNKRDLSLIFSQKIASAASVYTTNLVKGAPLLVTKENISDGYAQAVICNSGNANTCNANGVEIAEMTCSYIAKELNITPENIIVASTGVIGQPMDISPIKKGIPELVQGLGKKSEIAAEGIMTTDTKLKQIAVTFEIDGVKCAMGGIAKGSGMIHPNMATMLVFITTDVSITPKMLNFALKKDIQDTFNMVSVDGDTSTNDMVSVLANGMAGNTIISENGKAFNIFKKALNLVNSKLCEMIAKDGEGATKLLRAIVTSAKSNKDAKLVAKSIICSSLVKSAMFGSDANWGRVLCAIGYSGAKCDIHKVDVSFLSKGGMIEVCKDGHGVEFSEEEAKTILSLDEIDILVFMNEGKGKAKAWGCDLTYEYVKINGDYRT